MRKNRQQIHEQLSDGQVLSVYFFRKRINLKKIIGKPKYPDTKIVYIWTVGIYIGAGKKSSSRYFDLNAKKRIAKHLITGNGRIEGLYKAKEHVINFCEKLKQRDELHIYYDDNRRFNAYRYLLRFNGFVKRDGYYVFRHPTWWHWEVGDEA